MLLRRSTWDILYTAAEEVQHCDTETVKDYITTRIPRNIHKGWVGVSSRLII